MNIHKPNLGLQESKVRTTIWGQARVKLKTWLEGVLYPWFVPMEDYGFVQMARWSAERHIEYLAKENAELQDSIYSRKYQPFEHFGNEAVAVEFKHEDVQIDALSLGWEVSISNQHFYLMDDPKQEIARVRDMAIRRLSSAFMDHINKQLFGRGETKERSTVNVQA